MERTRRDEIEWLLDFEQSGHAEQHSWDAGGVRITKALVLAVLEVADAMTDIATAIKEGADGPADRPSV